MRRWFWFQGRRIRFGLFLVGPNNRGVDVPGVAPKVRVHRVGGMHVAPRQISAKEVIADIRAGATDEFLMKKYGINDKGLQSLFQKLITAKAITQADLDKRKLRNGVAPHSKQTTKGVGGQTIPSSNEGSRVSAAGAATGNIEVGKRNSSAQFPVVLSRFPQPGVPSEFSQLFAQITVEEQIEPGICRYVGVSRENPTVEVIGSEQEIKVASLGWGKPVPPDLSDALTDFLIGFLIGFCPGLSEDDYAELMHGIVHMASDPDGNGHYDKIVGQKRIGLTVQDTRCLVTINDADQSQAEASADDPELTHKMDLLNHALSVGAITEAEFNTKRADLERDLAKAREMRLQRAMLQEYFAKLSPLKEALKAGLLTDEQFSKKRRDLIGEFGENPLQCPMVLKGFPQPGLAAFSRFFKQVRLEEPIAPGLYRYVAVTKWALWLSAIGNDEEIKSATLSFSKPVKFWKDTDLLDTVRAFFAYFVPGLDQDRHYELYVWARKHLHYRDQVSPHIVEPSSLVLDERTVLGKYIVITDHFARSDITIEDVDLADV